MVTLTEPESLTPVSAVLPPACMLFALQPRWHRAGTAGRPCKQHYWGGSTLRLLTPGPACGRLKRAHSFPKSWNYSGAAANVSAMEFEGWEDSDYTHQLTRNIFNFFFLFVFNSRLR